MSWTQQEHDMATKPRNQIAPHKRPPATRGPGRPRRHPDETITTGTRKTTIGQLIVDRLAVGSYVEEAAMSAGVAKTVVYEWLKIGHQLMTDLDAVDDRGKSVRTMSSLTKHEQRCLTFTNAVDRAEAEWLVKANITLERLGEGGIPLETKTVKLDADGKVIETSTKTERTLPDAKVLTWRMERKDRARYGPRVGVGGDPDAGPIRTQDERVDSIMAALAQHQANRQEAS